LPVLTNVARRAVEMFQLRADIAREIKGSKSTFSNHQFILFFISCFIVISFLLLAMISCFFFTEQLINSFSKFFSSPRLREVKVFQTTSEKRPALDQNHFRL